MGALASQIISLKIVYSIVYSDTGQRKHQSSALLAFVWGIHRGLVNSPHKGPVTWKMFPFDYVIMFWCIVSRPTTKNCAWFIRNFAMLKWKNVTELWLALNETNPCTWIPVTSDRTLQWKQSCCRKSLSSYLWWNWNWPLMHCWLSLVVVHATALVRWAKCIDIYQYVGEIFREESILHTHWKICSLLKGENVRALIDLRVDKSFKMLPWLAIQVRESGSSDQWPVFVSVRAIINIYSSVVNWTTVNWITKNT